jgi:hypothetical protein
MDPAKLLRKDFNFDQFHTNFASILKPRFCLHSWEEKKKATKKLFDEKTRFTSALFSLSETIGWHAASQTMNQPVSSSQAVI